MLYTGLYIAFASCFQQCYLLWYMLCPVCCRLYYLLQIQLYVIDHVWDSLMTMSILQNTVLLCILWNILCFWKWGGVLGVRKISLDGNVLFFLKCFLSARAHFIQSMSLILFSILSSEHLVCHIAYVCLQFSLNPTARDRDRSQIITKTFWTALGSVLVSSVILLWQNTMMKAMYKRKYLVVLTTSEG